VRHPRGDHRRRCELGARKGVMSVKAGDTVWVVWELRYKDVGRDILELWSIYETYAAAVA
jgi:hypothetical protein